MRPDNHTPFFATFALVFLLITLSVNHVRADDAEITTVEPLTMAQTSQEKPIVISTDEPETSKETEHWISYGTFRLTWYCPCKKCCGHWAGGRTASGTQPVEGKTIAVDRHQIPLGSKVKINGHVYTAEDTGSGINEDCIDIFVTSHKRAVKSGIQYAEVLVEEN